MSRNSKSSSAAKALYCLGVRFQYPIGGAGDAFAVLATGNVVPDGAAGRFLYRNALALRPVPQGLMLLVCEPQRHSHC